jgi:hypothetical protein
LITVLASAGPAIEKPANPKPSGITEQPAQQTPAATATIAAGQSAPGAQDSAVRPVGQHSEFPMNPDAKWACDQQTVTAEPVWRSQESLSFSFKIRNTGTAALQIRARGG